MGAPAVKTATTPPIDVLRRELARRSLLGFTGWTFPGYRAGWHHRVLCRKLDALVRGEIQRLMVFMPPRHGKSELVSRRFPAYALGLDPDEQVMAASHGGLFAGELNRDVQRVVDSPEYAELFPGTRFPAAGDKLHVRNASKVDVVGRRGAYRSAGVSGSFVGRGLTLGIIDDPVKSRADVESKLQRDRLWDFYRGVFLARGEPLRGKPPRLVVTLTRWHEDDLAGRILRLADSEKSARQWEVISFPAIAEDARHADDPRAEGEALWPEAFSLEALSALRTEVGSREWVSQYQQRPSPGEGAVFRREWFRYWRRSPEDPGLAVLEGAAGEQPRRLDVRPLLKFITVDVAATAKTSGDWTVAACWAIGPGRELILLDLDRRRAEGPDQPRMIARMWQRWQPSYVGVESVAYQLTLVQTLQRPPFRLPVRELRPRGDKVARAMGASVRFEAGAVWLPENAPWLADYEDELLRFPTGRNDDQVDVTSYAAAEVALRSAALQPGVTRTGVDPLSRPSPWKA